MSGDLRERLQRALGDKYALERELGGGGMSRVFLAEDQSLARKVVIKVLAPELAATLNVERFAREVKVAARLQHPHVAPILSAGDADGLPFYVMPYVDGKSLRHRLQRERLPVNEAVAIWKDILRALEYAHWNGVVHRDIKPENVLLAGSSAVVIDFGIAKAISDSTTRASSDTLTQAGMSIGTPAYMAPEQALADPSVDHRADLYSAGVVAYEMLTGSPPFGGTGHALLKAQLTQDPPGVTTSRPEVPLAVAETIDVCLSMERSSRPTDASAVLRRLEAIPVSAERPAGRTPRRIALLTAAAVLVVGAFGLWVARAGGAPELIENRVFIANSGTESETEAVGRATSILLEQLSGIPQVDVVEASPGESVGDVDDSRVAAVARDAGARVAVVGRSRGSASSRRLDFRLLDAADGDLLRSFAIRTDGSDSAVAAALEPLASAVALAVHPDLGPNTIPAGNLPRIATLRTLFTALATWDRNDTTSQMIRIENAALAAADTAFPQARLWLIAAYMRSTALYYSPEARRIIDREFAALRAHQPRFTPFESALYDFVQAYRSASGAQRLVALRQLSSLAPDSRWTRAYATALLDLNRPIEARKALEREYRVAVAPATANMLASVYHYVGDYRSEARIAEEMLEREPSSPLAVIIRANAHAGLQDVKALEQDIERISGFTPNEIIFLFAGNHLATLAQELRAHGATELGDRTLARALAWYESRPAAEMERLDIFWRYTLAEYVLGRFDGAMAKSVELARRYPTDARFPGLIGRIHAHRGDTTRADSVAAVLASWPAAQLNGATTLERAMIASILGRVETSCALYREAFAQGQPFTIRNRLHWFSDTENIRNAPCFKQLIAPEG